MAPIFKGDKEVMPGELKLGNQDVKEVYLGTEKIWPPEPKIETVIYEHGVTPIATTQPDGLGVFVDFGNGYRLGFGGTMFGGPTAYARQVLMRKNPILDGDLDPICVLRWYPENGSGGIPTNVAEHYWYPCVDVNSPNLPEGHAEMWAEATQSGFDQVTSPFTGYKITFHKWHDMSRNTASTSYRESTNCTPPSSFNQSFNNSTQSGGKVAAILNTPNSTITSSLKKGYLTLLNNANNNNPYQFMVETMTGSTQAGKVGESWFWAIKKVEILL